jgi:hypothetical protein
MNLAAKPAADLDRLAATLARVTRVPLERAARLLERLRGGAIAMAKEAETTLSAEFGRPARCEEDLT